MTTPREVLSEADREAVSRAVEAAERATSGEIVVSVVGRCDDYPHALWRGATLGGFAALLAAWGLVASGRAEIWGGGAALWPWLLLPAPGGAALGYLLAALSSRVQRWLVTREMLAARVRARAEAAFLRAGVHRTRAATGILLFVSLFERRVEVRADRGISEAVPQGDWDAIARDIAQGVRCGHAREALVAAVGRCGDLLARYRLHSGTGDVDELPNRVRTED